jgi:hypothetical protein
MANVLAAERRVRDTPDRDDPPVADELGEERRARLDLRSCRPAIARLRSRMGRHDVPEKDVLLEFELTQDAVDDRGRRLGRAGSCQLTLGRERHARDARTAVARRFADEEQRRVRALLEVAGQPPSEEGRARAFRVLVERAADPRGRELLDECGRRYDGPSVTGSSGQPG